MGDQEEGGVGVGEKESMGDEGGGADDREEGGVGEGGKESMGDKGGGVDD